MNNTVPDSLDQAAVATRRGVLRLLLVIQTLVVVAALAATGPTWWRDRWVQDDAYVSFRYAKHFAHGEGLVYNLGQYVEGYTNFLWTILAAIPLWLGMDDPLPFMHAISLLLWLGSYALLLALGIRLFREGHWIAPLALLPLTVHWSFNMWFFSGMETPLVSFLTIAVVVTFARDPEKHPWALFWASSAAVGLTMTRPDGIVVLAAVAAAGLVLYWRPLVIERRWRTYLLRPALPIVLVYVPFNLWRIAYYGSFYPNTYYAKVAYLSFYERGWGYLWTYLLLYGLAPLLVFLVAGVLLVRTPAARRFLLGTLYATAFVFFYVVRLGGDFMEWRFLAPISGVLYPAIVIGSGVLAQWLACRVAVRWAGAIAVGVSASVAAALTARTYAATDLAREVRVAGQETIGLLRRYCDTRGQDWGSVGRLWDDILPHDVLIATTSAGIIPFFMDRQVLDLHGLTDPDIARAPVDPDKRGRMGHEHFLDYYDGMRARGADIYLVWADPKGFPQALTVSPQPDLETVSARLPDGRFTPFIILNHARVDRQRLRVDPRLVFFGDVPMGDRRQLIAVADAVRQLTLVDALDLESAPSEQAHGFQQIAKAGTPPEHNYHEKILHYHPPRQDIVLNDNGVRLSFQARWQVRNVSTRSALVMVARYDHTGSATYRLEVNGRLVPGELAMPGGDESWDEAVLNVPAEYLADGVNEFRLTNSEQSESNAEIYYLWFLQAGDGSAPESAPTAMQPP